MKKHFLFTLLMLSYHLLSAQTDTVFFNKNRKEITGSKDASYYRIIKPQGSLYTVTEYFLNGKVKMTGTFSSLKPDVLDGMVTWYSENGLLKSKGLFKNNKKQDHFIRYYPDGKIKSDAIYKADTLNGEYKLYYPNRQLKRADLYNKGKYISGKCYTSSGADTAFYSYLQPPEFIGGDEKMQEYLKANLVYPRLANVTGTVKVKFIVNIDGEISEVRLQNSVDPLLDKQALELVRNMPRWKPGRMYEENAEFLYILPVTFALNK